ncbi:hypothetical protein [Mesorhizobium sp. L2C067A000]|uniref:hypothetical protein n=1 Tax=Mesorhizobium sp. L2C067A000 TaxID=1287106 RepID=UPI0012DE3E6D|nr:hypothetical protein [Mesorhizobium sp. L2C067A000]
MGAATIASSQKGNGKRNLYRPNEALSSIKNDHTAIRQNGYSAGHSTAASSTSASISSLTVLVLPKPAIRHTVKALQPRQMAVPKNDQEGANYAWMYGAQARKDSKEREAPAYWQEHADATPQGSRERRVGALRARHRNFAAP